MVRLKTSKLPHPDRVDWDSLKGRLDLATVVTGYLGPAPGRRGSGRLWWRCPFHPDKNPSLRVKGGSWRCFGCKASGDAASFVMKYKGVAFVEAIRILDDGRPGGRPPRTARAVPSGHEAGPPAADW